MKNRSLKKRWKKLWTLRSPGKGIWKKDIISFTQKKCSFDLIHCNCSTYVVRKLQEYMSLNKNRRGFSWI